jgi:Na+/H+-dicarboxylate symporter
MTAGGALIILSISCGCGALGIHHLHTTGRATLGTLLVTAAAALLLGSTLISLL